MTRKNIAQHIANALANSAEYAPQAAPMIKSLGADNPDALRLIANLLLIEANGLDSAQMGDEPELVPTDAEHDLVRFMYQNLHLEANAVQERIERKARLSKPGRN